MEANLLVYDVGSTYTKLSAFTLSKNTLNYINRTQVPTTVDDIEYGLNNAIKKLEENDSVITINPKILSTSSALGGLRMVALGYMPRVTAKAAKEVAMSAGSRVLEIISHEDPPEYRIQVLREIKPDIILLAGGTDGGDQESLVENAEVIAKSRVESIVIIAGNKDAQAQAENILNSAGIATIRVPNVMPTIHELKVKPAREAIHEQFIKQITRAKGLNKLIDLVSNKRVIPTPGAILLAAELLAKGTFQTEGMGDILVVDIGGATTDIHSVLPELEKLSIEEKGLVVNNEKQPSFRTVEGNLGLRVSATGIVETVGPQGVLAKIGKQGEEYEKELINYTQFLEKNPEHISQSDLEKEFDIALAITAIEVAMKRHAGYLTQDYNPLMGIVPGTPIGRDLRKVKHVIAVGGIFTHSTPEIRKHILEQAFKNPGVSLLPIEPNFMFDEQYVMYAVGILAENYGDLALNFAKKYFNLEE